MNLLAQAIEQVLTKMAANTDLDVAGRVEDYEAFVLDTIHQLPTDKAPPNIAELWVALVQLKQKYPVQDAAEISEYRLRLMEAGKDELR